MEPHNWKKDPRLKQMPPEKLDYLTSFAQQVAQLPKDKILSAFLSMQMEANQKGIRFNDAETQLLVQVLTENMPPEEKRKLNTLRFIAQKLAARPS